MKSPDSVPEMTHLGAISESTASGMVWILRYRRMACHILASAMLTWNSVPASEIWAWGMVRVFPRPVKSVGAGTEIAIAVLDDGRVVSWGGNVTPPFLAPHDLGPVKKVVGSNRSILALLEDGTVRIWGDTTVTPSPPSGLDHVVDIAASSYHFLALRDDGTVVGWGFYGRGDSTVPKGLRDVKAIATGTYHSLALTKNGEVIAWGDTADGKTSVPPLPGKAVSIAAGTSHSLAVLEDGKVVGWGLTGGSFWQNLPVPDSAQNAVAVYSGGEYSLVVRKDGRIFAWGYNGFQQLAVPEDAINLHGLAVGSNHVMGFRADGSIISWGSQYGGLASDIFWFNEPIGDAIQVEASGGAVFGLTKGGRVLGAGYNYKGALNIPETLSGVASIAMGTDHGVALLKDGTVRAWGDTTYGKTQVPQGLKNVASVYAGGNQSAALLSDGRVVRWGDTTIPFPAPQSVQLRPRRLSLGYQHLLALDSAGTLYSSGGNVFGETKIPAVTFPIVDIATGLRISMLRGTNDTVKVWGRVWPPHEYVPGVKDMAAGAVHALALSGQGNITGWGENYYGQITTPNEVIRPDQITAGQYFSAALMDASIEAATNGKKGKRDVVRLPVGRYSVKVLNLQGRVIREGSADWNGLVWRMQELPNGVVMIKVEGDSKLYRQVQHGQ